MTEDECQEFLEHMRNGMQRGAAAYAMGKTRIEVMDFIAADPEFERHDDRRRGRSQGARSTKRSIKPPCQVRSPQRDSGTGAARRARPRSIAYEGEDMDSELEAIMRLTTDGED